ncbi:MAG: NADPH-dependent F420 reductase [Actinomycetota bacterium]
MSVERVAIIGGTGEEGFGLASRWTRAGIEVVIGSRERGRAAEAVERLRALVPGARASGLENTAAAAAAPVVVVTVPFAGQAATYRSIRDHVGEETIVIDCTAPLAAATGGRASQLLGVWQGSAAQQAAALLERGTLCAAFHSLSASLLAESERQLEGDVLVCGAQAGKGAVRELVEAIPKLRFVDAGPLDGARIVESMTALLIGINRRYKTHAGIRITGLPS